MLRMTIAGTQPSDEHSMDESFHYYAGCTSASDLSQPDS